MSCNRNEVKLLVLAYVCVCLCVVGVNDETRIANELCANVKEKKIENERKKGIEKGIERYTKH